MVDTSHAPGAERLANAGTRKAYEALIEHAREASLLGGTASLLGWDQETGMPRLAAAHRGKQRAQLARLVHEMRTDARVDGWLATCEADPACTADPTAVAAVNVRELRRDYDRSRKLPTSLVEALARASSAGLEAWKAARACSEFPQFVPALEQILALNRDKAACLGWPADGEPWDALADAYEPGITAREVDRVFGELAPRLVSLVGRIAATGRQPATVDLAAPIEVQRRFVAKVIGHFGFDFDRGRLDISTHPFCSGSHPSDVRLTTRFREDDASDALGSTLHECGHGLYEQGLLEEHNGTPMGSAISLGIHESQSRMWENQVGRSRAFWTWCAPVAGEMLGKGAKAIDPEAAYRAANRVEPSFIRVEADEATYNLHILLRFGLERALIKGDLAAKDLPAAWNERFQRSLGLAVPDDARGCLQDIHWAMSLFGYFPTYTLGNLYAAQLYDQARTELPGLEDDFAHGQFARLRRWLAEQVHAHGKRYGAGELCRRITGRPVSAGPLLGYLEGKLVPLYGLG